MNTSFVKPVNEGFRAELIVKCSEVKTCEAIYNSLEPDNVMPPPEIEITSCIDSDNYEYRFLIKAPFKARKFDSLRGTIDEVLSILEAIDNALTMLK
ncbi:MAG TPA: hypothetical protein EYP90_06820 [Chromatiaceae bacterium]|nr:hypothetical protein [Chromatiaceae bacterium]